MKSRTLSNNQPLCQRLKGEGIFQIPISFPSFKLRSSTSQDEKKFFPCPLPITQVFPTHVNLSHRCVIFKHTLRMLHSPLLQLQLAVAAKSMVLSLWKRVWFSSVGNYFQYHWAKLCFPAGNLNCQGKPQVIQKDCSAWAPEEDWV